MPERLFHHPVTPRPGFDQANPLQRLWEFASFVESGFIPGDEYLYWLAECIRNYLSAPVPGALEKSLGIKSERSGRGHAADKFKRETALKRYAQRYAILLTAADFAEMRFTKQKLRWLVLLGVEGILAPESDRPSEETFRKEFESAALGSHYFSEEREVLEWELLKQGRVADSLRARFPLSTQATNRINATFALAKWLIETPPEKIEKVLKAHGARLEREDERRLTEGLKNRKRNRR